MRRTTAILEIAVGLVLALIVTPIKPPTVTAATWRLSEAVAAAVATNVTLPKIELVVVAVLNTV